MRVTKSAVTRTCAVCDRTLLMGEEALRFSPDGVEYVDVCTLCNDAALDHGWAKEGLASAVSLGHPPRRRRQRTIWQTLLGAREEEPMPVVSEPILRRLSDGEMALVEAVELFNQSQFRRTVVGVARSLGEPRVSVVPLSGVNGETVITVAWDITWYQYRVSPESGQPVRIEERGTDSSEIGPAYTGWNASIADDGRIMPELAPV
ncbi:MAG: hypothetical protein ACKVUT_09795 [Gaiella sp.]